MSAPASPAAVRSPSFIRQEERGRCPASICQPACRISSKNARLTTAITVETCTSPTSPSWQATEKQRQKR
jgi:hypothetical protein